MDDERCSSCTLNLSFIHCTATRLQHVCSHGNTHILSHMNQHEIYFRHRACNYTKYLHGAERQLLTRFKSLLKLVLFHYCYEGCVMVCIYKHLAVSRVSDQNVVSLLCTSCLRYALLVGNPRYLVFWSLCAICKSM